MIEPIQSNSMLTYFNESISSVSRYFPPSVDQIQYCEENACCGWLMQSIQSICQIFRSIFNYFFPSETSSERPATVQSGAPGNMSLQTLVLPAEQNFVPNFIEALENYIQLANDPVSTQTIQALRPMVAEMINNARSNTHFRITYENTPHGSLVIESEGELFNPIPNGVLSFMISSYWEASYERNRPKNILKLTPCVGQHNGRISSQSSSNQPAVVSRLSSQQGSSSERVRGFPNLVACLNLELAAARDPNPSLTMLTLQNVCSNMVDHAGLDADMEISSRYSNSDGRVTAYSICIKSTGETFNPISSLLLLSLDSLNPEDLGTSVMITPYWRATYERNEEKNILKLVAQIAR